MPNDDDRYETLEFRLNYVQGQLIAQNSLLAGLLHRLLASDQAAQEMLDELARQSNPDTLGRIAAKGPGFAKGYVDYLDGIAEGLYDRRFGQDPEEGEGTA